MLKLSHVPSISTSFHRQFPQNNKPTGKAGRTGGLQRVKCPGTSPALQIFLLWRLHMDRIKNRNLVLSSSNLKTLLILKDSWLKCYDYWTAFLLYLREKTILCFTFNGKNVFLGGLFFHHNYHRNNTGDTQGLLESKGRWPKLYYVRGCENTAHALPF